MIFNKQVMDAVFESLDCRFDEMADDPDTYLSHSLEKIREFLDSHNNVRFKDIEHLIIRCYADAYRITYLMGLEDGVKMQHSLHSGNFATAAIINFCMDIDERGRRR